MKKNDIEQETRAEIDNTLEIWRNSYSKYVLKFEGANDLEPLPLSAEICKRHVSIIQSLLTHVDAHDEMKATMISLACKWLAEFDSYIASYILEKTTKH